MLPSSCLLLGLNPEGGRLSQCTSSDAQNSFKNHFLKKFLKNLKKQKTNPFPKFLGKGEEELSEP